MNIYISDDSETVCDLYRKDMVNTVRLILKKLELSENIEISIHFTDDTNMRYFNKTYRKLDRTTDVLSFPQEFGDNNPVLGDILISVDAVKRQSETYGVETENEIERLLVHGILHLLGYDHKKKKERNIMRKQEYKLINYLNNL